MHGFTTSAVQSFAEAGLTELTEQFLTRLLNFSITASFKAGQGTSELLSGVARCLTDLRLGAFSSPACAAYCLAYRWFRFSAWRGSFLTVLRRVFQRPVSAYWLQLAPSEDDRRHFLPPRAAATGRAIRVGPAILSTMSDMKRRSIGSLPAWRRSCLPPANSTMLSIQTLPRVRCLAAGDCLLLSFSATSCRLHVAAIVLRNC